MSRLLGILVGVVIIVAAWSIFILGPSAYSGKEVFYTTAEYTVFKEHIAHKEVSLKEISVLSSEPPIIVQFDVRANREYDFPYGERSIIVDLVLPVVLLTVVGGVVIWLNASRSKA